MSNPKLHYGDLVYIELEGFTLYYTINLKNPVFSYAVEAPQVAFKNAIFQLLPSTFDPFLQSTEVLSLDKKAIKSGDTILIYHVESRTLINSYQESRLFNEKLIGADSELNDGCVFSITDISRSTEDLNYGEKIHIQKGDLFLNKDEPEEAQKFELNPAESYTRVTSDFPKVIPRRNPLSNLGSCVSSRFVTLSARLTLKKFQGIEELHRHKDVIHNGDYVRIRYNNQWLSFFQNQEKKQEAYFDRVNDSYQALNYTHTIFQIVKDKSGDPINPNDKYLIKHFMSGDYLHYKSCAMLKMFNVITSSDDEDEQAYCKIEPDSQENIIKEKITCRIMYISDGYEAYVKPTEPTPVKNVQFEMNTLYFFGFKVPEEYSYKNLKCLKRALAEANTPFEKEDYDIVLEKVDPDHMYSILKCEALANELQRLIDILTIPNIFNKVIRANNQVEVLIDRFQDLLSKFYIKGKLDPTNLLSEPKSYRIKVPDRFFQVLVREFRIFDLIHMINFLLIKKNHITEDFRSDRYLVLYNLFTEILLASLDENIFNRFYNSQYIRIYIHFMSQECEGVFSSLENVALRDKMRTRTVDILKQLLWDEDLDGLGQLNFYQNLMFSATREIKTFETYYLEIVEHISNSRAYNLTNSFRDAFITNFMAKAADFKYIFPILSIDEDNEVKVQFNREEQLDLSLSEVQKNSTHQQYFTVALRTLTALSTSKLMTYYHAVIKYYPLKLLQSIIKHEDVDLSTKQLCHLIILYAYFNYLKLPFQYIPSTIQTSSDDLRSALNEEEIKIIDACKTVIGESEKNLLQQNAIINDVMDHIVHLNAQDCSIQISLMQRFNESEPDLLLIELTMFYINAVITNGNINVHFLNQAKDALIKIRKICNSQDDSLFGFLPRILQMLALINEKRAVHSTNAIYTQIIKSQNPSALDFSRKLVAGLKKIHLESFAPIQMIALNEPKISSLALKYLKNVANYEESLADELEKFVILASEKDVQNIKEIIEITLSLNQEVRKYLVQKEKNNGTIKASDPEINKHIEQLEKLLVIIYKPEEHFLFKDASVYENSKTSKQRFFELLKKEKIAFRDKPFKINFKAINLHQQTIFRLLHVQEVLLQLLNCTVLITVETESQAFIYLPRLILIILIAFTYKNKSNQDVLAYSHGFISLYYQQKYIDKSCDTLTLFAEVMRDNEGLLEISKKFIYDITCYTFLGTIKPRVINKESGAYLCTAIMSMHYLHKANIPKVTFDSFSVMESKFNNIFVEDFAKLNLVATGVVDAPFTFEMPPSYYNIRETLESTIELVQDTFKEGKLDLVEKFRKIFKCQKIVDALCSSSFRTQFELKDLFLKLMSILNFSKHLPNPIFFSTSEIAAEHFIIFLINELVEYSMLIQNTGSGTLQPIKESFLSLVSKDYIKLRTIGHRKQIIYLDELPLSIIWKKLYIFSTCWTLTAKICLQYPEIAEKSKQFEMFLRVSQILITFSVNSDLEVLKKISKYILAMIEISAFMKYKVQIQALDEKIRGKIESILKDLSQNRIEELYSDDDNEENKLLKKVVCHMRSTREQDEISTIQQFCKHVIDDPQKALIVSELISVIEKNPCYIQKDIYNFNIEFVNSLSSKILSNEEGKGSEVDKLLPHPSVRAQNELSFLNIEIKLMKGINIAQTSKNLLALLDLLLIYSIGSNPLTFKNMKVSLEKLKKEIISKENDYAKANDIILFLLEKLLDCGNLTSKVEKLIKYCIQSIKVSQKDIEEGKKIFDRNSESLHSKLEAFCQEFDDSGADEVIKILGPLPINFFTIGELFKVLPEDSLSLKALKKTFASITGKSNIENILKSFLAHTTQPATLEDLDLIKMEVILILDLLISQIKPGLFSIKTE